MTRFLAALLCAFCLVATPAASAWAAGQPLTQADLKPLAEDDFDAKVKVLNALAAAPAEQAGPSCGRCRMMRCSMRPLPACCARRASAISMRSAASRLP